MERGQDSLVFVFSEFTFIATVSTSYNLLFEFYRGHIDGQSLGVYSINPGEPKVGLGAIV